MDYFELGYINSSMTSIKQGFVNHGVYSEYGSLFCYGFYAKYRIMFLLGQDFSVKGIRYAYPLKGSYIRLDMPISFLHFDKFSFYPPHTSTTLYTPAILEYTTLNSVLYVL